MKKEEKIINLLKELNLMIPNLAIINYIDNYNDAGVIKDIDFI
jgi:hypothetical protein